MGFFKFNKQLSGQDIIQFRHLISRKKYLSLVLLRKTCPSPTRRGTDLNFSSRQGEVNSGIMVNLPDIILPDGLWEPTAHRNLDKAAQR